MPWTPRFTPVVAPSRRLLAYDARAGRLRDSSGGHRGTVYVRLGAFSRQVAGRVWWARWSRPTPMITVYVVDGPGIADVWITGGEVEEELRDWEHGQFRFRVRSSRFNGSTPQNRNWRVLAGGWTGPEGMNDRARRGRVVIVMTVR